MKKPKFPLQKFWLFVVFAGIAGVVFFYKDKIFLASLFKVSRIECHTQYGPCLPELEEIFAPLLGKNIFFVSGESVKKIAKDTKGIENVKTRIRFPGKVEVQVIKNKAQVAVPNQEGKFRLLDVNGEVVGEVEDPFLPTLSFSKDSVESSALGNAILIIALARQAGFSVSGEIQGSYMYLKTNGAQAVLPLNKDPSVLVGSLQFMYNRFTIEGKKPKTIDLRFKNPVVSFE